MVNKSCRGAVSASFLSDLEKGKERSVYHCHPERSEGSL